MGSNKAGYFLETAVFIEGNQKGVIRLPEDCGGWGWQHFVDELHLLMAQLVAKVSLAVPVAVVNAGVVGSPPTLADVLVAPPGGLKSSFVETQAPMEVSTGLGSVLSMGGGSSLAEALRSLAVEFLAKVRVEVDRVIFFRLGFKLNASKDIRRRLGRVFSRLGLKPKLLHGFHLRGKRKRLTSRGPCLRHCSDAVTQVKVDGGGEWVPRSDLSQRETSSEKEEVVLLGDAVFPEAMVSEARTGSLSLAKGRLQVLGHVAMADGSRMGSVSPAMGFLRCSGDVVGLGPEAGPVAAASVSIPTVSDPSPTKGLLQRGFLLRRSSDLASLSCGEERRPSGLELKARSGS
jgi:hypothetical protein